MNRNAHPVLALALLAVTLLPMAMLGGCAADKSPGAGQGDPWIAPYNDPQITVLTPELRSWLGFQPAVVVREPTLTVQVPMRNMSERTYLLAYRILFYDQDGMELDPKMGWKMVPLSPKQNVRLRANALDERAVNYRFEVKWSR